MLGLTDRHPCQGNRHRQLGITLDNPSIDFESDQEQEQSEANVCH